MNGSFTLSERPRLVERYLYWYFSDDEHWYDRSLRVILAIPTALLFCASPQEQQP
jgi:hypothetical protein